MVLSAADRLAILDLVARYNHTMDSRDAEGWADCFAPDGVFDGGPKLQASGREGLVAFMERLIARDIPAVHWNNNIVIEGSGDAARMMLYLLVIDLRGDAARASHLGVYHDELVRTADGWRFRKHRLGHR